MELISMTDYVLKQEDNFLENKTNFRLQCYWKIYNYANFLKQPLTLGMFVPCDEYDVPLSDPKNSTLQNCRRISEYEKAKEKILFEGAVLDREQDGTFIVFDKFHFDICIIEYSTIEDLSWQGLTLTESAKKQIGL